MGRVLERVYRATVWALIVTDAVVGIAMFLSPPGFGAVTEFPVRDIPVMRGYGERIALLSLVYLWILWHPTAAGWLVWVPLLDEGVNTLADAYEFITASLPADVVGPMLAVHALFTLFLAVSTPAVAASGRSTAPPGTMRAGPAG